MNGATLLAFVMTAGLSAMVALPALAALWVKLFRRGERPARVGSRTVEIDDVFSPERRIQADRIATEDMLRADAESGDGDPLGDFPDPDDLRDQLDPEHVHEARRARSRRPYRGR